MGNANSEGAHEDHYDDYYDYYDYSDDEENETTQEAVASSYDDYSDEYEGESDESENSFSSSVNSSDSDSSEEVATPDEEELVLFSFYSRLLGDLMSCFSVNKGELSHALRQIVRGYSRVSNGLPEDVDYTFIPNCLGYLLRYAACHAALVRELMITLIYTSPPAEITSKLSKQSLDIVFLGGGPGNDAVGFLSALYGQDKPLSQLNIHVVDKMGGWEEVFEKTFDKVIDGDCGEASLLCDDVNVTTSFKECDVYSSISDLDGQLMDADIIFLVKFLSHVPQEESRDIIEDVITRMKTDALLILIDYPFRNAVFSKLKGLKLIHRSPPKEYRFGVQETRFGWQNIANSTAELRVYKKLHTYRKWYR